MRCGGQQEVPVYSPDFDIHLSLGYHNTLHGVTKVYEIIDYSRGQIDRFFKCSFC